MRFFRNHHKSVALVAVFFFIALLQITSFPLQAQDHQAPGLVEKESVSGGSSHGKGPLVPILIGVGVLAVAAVLIFVVFKTSYDITGTWAGTETYGSGTPIHVTTTFTGDKKTGTVSQTYQSITFTGTYTVDGDTVAFSVGNTNYTYSYAGKFTDKNTMSGQVVSSGGSTGTWTYTRGASSAAIPSGEKKNKHD